MRCAACGFENMPGSDNCARCASPMRLESLVMDVNPPRAGRLTKRLRRVTPAWHPFGGLRDQLERSESQLAIWWRRQRESGTQAPRSVIWRSVVPGWGHFRVGQKYRGHLFLWGFLVCLIPGLLWAGTTLGGLLLGLAFSIHVSAVGDIFGQYLPRRDFNSLTRNAIFATLVVGLFIYFPCWLLLSSVASPRTIRVLSGPELQPGDIVLVNRSFHRAGWMRPGELVLYNLGLWNVNGEPVGRERRIYRYSGDRIDRIIAEAGDHVVWNNGKLWINGKLSAVRPVMPMDLPKHLEFTAPPDTVVILPSTIPRFPPPSEADYHAMACVSRMDVEGSVYFRLHPITRIEILH